jgi:hypothetical protein
MLEKTAELSAAVRILNDPATARLPRMDEVLLRNYLQGYAEKITQAENRPESELPSFAPPPAAWLGAIQRRLNASIGVEGAGERRDGSSLTKEVVSNANSFFEATSNLFPSEPYLYGSRSGDLIAEFESDVGQMTVVVTSRNLIAFAVVGNETVKKQLAIVPFASAAIRREIAELASRLGSGRYGSMDSEK